MRSSADIILDRIAYLGFLVLFPGFVVYHYAVSSGWMPAFLGGLFGSVSLVLAGIGLIQLSGYFQARVTKTLIFEWTFVFFVVYLFVWTIVAGIVIASMAYAAPAVMESFATLAIWLAVFFVGSRTRIQSKENYFILVLLALMIVGLFFYAMLSYKSFIGPYLLFQGQTDQNNLSSTYQGIARSIVVVTIVIASMQSKFWRQLFVLFLSIIWLASLGSRAHLFATILVALSLFALSAFRKKNLRSSVLLMVVLIAVSYAMIEVVLSTRAAEIFRLSESASWQARLTAQSRVVETLTQNPFLGAFGYHHDEPVGYSHNALSAWAQYGAIGFSLYIFLIIYALWLSAKKLIFQERISPLWYASFQLNLMALILAAVTEPIMGSVFPALGWGFSVNALRDERRQRHLRREVSAVAVDIVEEQKWPDGLRLSWRSR